MMGRAFVFTGVNEPFEEREFPLPEVEPEGILVRLTMANICGSDLHGWHGETPREPPTIMGHEMTGRVAKLGRAVKTDAAGQPLAEGDRIVYSYFLPCRRCQPCLGHDEHHCTSRRIGAGRRRSDQAPHFNGAFADYFYLKPGHFVMKTPDTLSDRLVSPLNCALSQVIYGLHQVDLQSGDSVVIQGAGGLGLYAAAVAKEAGAVNVVVLDRVPDRLELARQFGADHVIDIDEVDTPQARIEAVMDLTGGGGHVVAELTGHPAALVEGIKMARAEGRYLVIGNISAKHTIEFNPAWLVHQNRRMVGVGGYQAWALQRGLELLARTHERYPFEKVLSDIRPLEEINEAFRNAESSGAIRTGLVCAPDLVRL
jgi:L-iditol 2-dehydrogenase